MESKRMKNMEVRNTPMAEKKQDQHFVYQGKNPQAGEYWLDLITQITLDYRRSKDIHSNVSSKDDTATLIESNDAVAV